MATATSPGCERRRWGAGCAVAASSAERKRLGVAPGRGRVPALLLRLAAARAAVALCLLQQLCLRSCRTVSAAAAVSAQLPHCVCCSCCARSCRTVSAAAAVSAQLPHCGCCSSCCCGMRAPARVSVAPVAQRPASRGAVMRAAAAVLAAKAAWLSGSAAVVAVLHCLLLCSLAGRLWSLYCTARCGAHGLGGHCAAHSLECAGPALEVAARRLKGAARRPGSVSKFRCSLPMVVQRSCQGLRCGEQCTVLQGGRAHGGRWEGGAHRCGGGRVMTMNTPSVGLNQS